MAISADVRRQVVARGGQRCAYCLTTEVNCGLQMHIDHILPEMTGGATTLENLCLACFACNIYKGARQVAVDPITGETWPLFHPLRQRWQDHFEWSAEQTQIIGLRHVGALPCWPYR